MSQGNVFSIVSIFTVLLTACQGFDINDPKTNLDFFVRTSGSVNSSLSTPAYFNGSVYIRQTGSQLQTVMLFEGYNINRKILQANGSYLSLSLEFVVYRDPITHTILKVWMNPMTSSPNEVFYVANNPVNALLRLGDIFPTVLLPNGEVVFNADIVLEYPNPLDPANYPKYSAGEVYDGVELFSYISNATLLASTPDISVGFAGTWARRSQYLPWMEMGKTKGHLYYTTLVWSCPNGLDCIADDILEIVKKEYTEFTDAPKTYEVPNETSWVQFKKKIDSRRASGQPDIILPVSPVVGNVTTYSAHVDARVENFFQQMRDIKMYFNGSAYSEIVGKQPIKLFNIEGNVVISVSVPSGKQQYHVTINGGGNYKDAQTGQVLKTWTNPITGSVNQVPDLLINSTLDFEHSMVYTIDIPLRNCVGLIAAQSVSDMSTGREVWSVNIADIVFHEAELAKDPRATFLTGTWSHFGSWFPWMAMQNVTGNIVVKTTAYRVLQ